LSGRNDWSTCPVKRLGVPSLAVTDGPHGVRAVAADDRLACPTTAFPTGIGLGATWNKDLIYKVGAALGEETIGTGCHILLGPTVNIIRHPLAGRNFECYGEDPCHAGYMGANYINGAESRGCGTSLKHFACNSQETARRHSSSKLDQRTLHEIYLAQFEYIIKNSDPATVMCAYNKVNGTWAGEHKYLLKDLLKGKWGFRGAVISDWGANHSTVDSVKNGLDLEMPGPPKYYGELLFEAFLHNQLDEAVLDEAAGRILRLALKYQNSAARSKAARKKIAATAHAGLAWQSAAESITLLKNENNLLPLADRSLKKLAVIGPNAAVARLGGGGSAYVTPPYSISPLQGIKEEFKNKLKIYYEEGCDNYEQPPLLPGELLTGPDGQKGKLQAEFFLDRKMQGKPAAVKTLDKPAWMMFLTYGDITGLVSGIKAMRFRAFLQVKEDHQYLFQVMGRDKNKLYINDKLLLSNKENDNPDATQVKRIFLQKGKRYKLVLDYYSDFGSAANIMSLRFAKAYPPGNDPRFRRALELAAACDAVVFCGGYAECYESEGFDRPHMRLPNRQNELLTALQQQNRNIIAVLNSGVPVEMPWAEKVPAILQAYYPGMEGGRALARIISGRVNPSGKLTVSYPCRLTDTPAYINFPGQDEVNYGEGIFVGYRYYDHRQMRVLFPFGHGLSYTSFRYSAVKVQTLPEEKYKISCRLQNSGSKKGSEVVQLYIKPPAGSFIRPPQELKAFRKIELKPGASRKVTFVLNRRAFSFYDHYLQQWRCAPGLYKIAIGASSRDIRLWARLKIN
ncbi:MAG TPA: glycoside hydrolase family 3 C-terminal domain-containing protein, partial [Spirochaetota bacterium]|nr:glycoside hydrolase family 3 C-terminal domain-containing protein [Spirochaetota bacterium]